MTEQTEISKAASALGKLAKGHKKEISEAEREARRQRAAYARGFRKVKQQNNGTRKVTRMIPDN